MARPGLRVALAAVAALGVLAACAPPAAEGLDASAAPEWTAAWLDGVGGYETAFRESRRDAGPVFVYFYTDWCGYCRQFERELLSDGSVMQYLDASVRAVRVNPEAGPAEAELARRYGVRGFPALYLHGAGEPERFVSVRRTVMDAAGLRLKTPDEFIAELSHR